MSGKIPVHRLNWIHGPSPTPLTPVLEPPHMTSVVSAPGSSPHAVPVPVSPGLAGVSVVCSVCRRLPGLGAACGANTRAAGMSSMCSSVWPRWMSYVAQVLD